MTRRQNNIRTDKLSTRSLSVLECLGFVKYNPDFTFFALPHTIIDYYLST
jgi:hypothetical protein